ncbi:hypothetical protein N7512_002253 [Penicillium capsulatum]|nr:hypothetical protein N7512_002253 [Penicillium capsulatum]
MEVLPVEPSTIAAKPSGYSNVQWSDSCPEDNDSSQGFAQSPLPGLFEDVLADLAKDCPSKTLADRPIKPKSFPRLPSGAVKVLRLWFHQHHDSPYPTSDERQELEQQTGLNQTQISNWFANARRRKRRTKEHVPSPRPEIDPTAHSLLSPLERWQHSPPESEPAATSDILQALESTSAPSDWSLVYGSDKSSLSENSSGSSFMFGAPSMGNFEHSGSSASDTSFNPPNWHFQRPPTPLPGIRPRRRRRKVSRSAFRLEKSITQRNRAYQCTFCCESFRSKYDWVRHEKALHISVDWWRCAPEGGLIEIDGINVCVFCHAPDADENHLETHNYLRCRDRSPELRVFSRKDHLSQHLRLMHNVKDHRFLDRWRDVTLELHSRCGFCNSSFKTWEERMDHLAEHFKQGADMSQWQGDWGFEPHVACQVENAMPPYLLGQERSTMDPITVSEVGQFQEGELSSSNDNFPKGIHVYTVLYNGLVAYIQDQISLGNYPTDDMIQSRARFMIYGSDDPWNQTYAENPVWLAALKNDVGLLEPQSHFTASNET